MGKPTGFLEYPRRLPERRPVELRRRDWREIYAEEPADEVTRQAARCMDCGLPFCHQACPLGNLIPEWNDFTYRGDLGEALTRLHRTNNFPEFTGRLCPAPCEAACVLGINDQPVTIERLEYEIIERGYAAGRVRPEPSPERLRRAVAVIGSGPAGLAAAQQLARVGYAVTVFERADAPGGLLRYGIPEFKLEKSVLDRRLSQLRAEGVQFRTGCEVRSDGEVTLGDVRRQFDAVVVAVGAGRARTLAVPGADLAGVEYAMTYLTAANRAVHGPAVPSELSARDRDVVIIGGGDTGADCLGTAHRQGARTVTQLEILDRPPDQRREDQPWPLYPQLFRIAGAHEEGGERLFGVETVALHADSSGRVARLSMRSRADRTPHDLAASLVLIAAGFVGAELDALDLPTSSRGTVAIDGEWRCQSDAGLAPVFACGDAVRGASLIVWAIAEGRSAAASVDRALRGPGAMLAPSLPPHFDPWGPELPRPAR